MSDATSLPKQRIHGAADPRAADRAGLVPATDAAPGTTDETGCRVAANEAAAILLGLERTDLLGRPVGPTFEDAAGWPRAVVRRASTVDDHPFEATSLRPMADAAAAIEAGTPPDLRARLAPSVRAVGNFAEIFRSRTFGPLGHDRYGDFADALTEAVRAIERAMDGTDDRPAAPTLPTLLDERVCSLRGLVTAALRGPRRDMAVGIAGDDTRVICDPVLLAQALDAMIGSVGADRRAGVTATLSRLADGRTMIGIHHREDGYPLLWARGADALPLDGGDRGAAAEIDVAVARRVFMAHGGDVAVNTEGDAGISVFGTIGASRLLDATPRRPTPGTDIRRAIYVDATVPSAAFAGLPFGAFRVNARGRILDHVAERRPDVSAGAPVGAALGEGPLRALWSDGLRRMVRRAAEHGVHGLHEITVDVGDRLRIVHAEAVPARARPGQAWVFLRTL